MLKNQNGHHLTPSVAKWKKTRLLWVQVEVPVRQRWWDFSILEQFWRRGSGYWSYTILGISSPQLQGRHITVLFLFSKLCSELSFVSSFCQMGVFLVYFSHWTSFPHVGGELSRRGESPESLSLFPSFLPKKRNASPAVYIYGSVVPRWVIPQRRGDWRPTFGNISCYCLYLHLWFCPILHFKFLLCVELAFFHIEKMKLPSSPRA